MGPGPKIERSQLRLASLFQKFRIIVSDHSLTLDLFLNATPKGWKESIGFPETELYDKSFEKNSLKKIKYSRTSPSCYWRVCFFLLVWLTQNERFFKATEKKSLYRVGNYSTILVITKIYIFLLLYFTLVLLLIMRSQPASIGWTVTSTVAFYHCWSYTEHSQLLWIRCNIFHTLKPFNKGSGICLMNTSLYISKIEKHLADPSTYKELSSNPTQAIKNNVLSTLNYPYKIHWIDDVTRHHLTSPKPARTPLFYGIPKVHKTNIPLRPILSACASPTDQLLNYFTNFIQLLVKILPLYMRDSKYFL